MSEISITFQIAGSQRDAGVPADDIHQAFTAMAASAIVRASLGGIQHG